MKTEINNHRKIYGIQEEFHSLFPYLKIEFYGKPSKEGGPQTEKIVEKSSKTIGDCRNTHNDGIITVTPNMTVGELESTFSNVYGLKVSILRKSGKSWLETALTNGWTLEEQNSQGKTLSEGVA